MGGLEEAADALGAGQARWNRRVIDVPQRPVAGKPDVVELDLVKPHCSQLSGKTDDIVPYPPVIGVGPIQAVFILPGQAAAHVG